MKKESQFTFRLSSEQNNMLNDLARENRVSRSELLRLLIGYGGAVRLIESQPVNPPSDDSDKEASFWARFNFGRLRRRSKQAKNSRDGSRHVREGAVEPRPVADGGTPG